MALWTLPCGHCICMKICLYPLFNVMHACIYAHCSSVGFVDIARSTPEWWNSSDESLLLEETRSYG